MSTCMMRPSFPALARPALARPASCPAYDADQRRTALRSFLRIHGWSARGLSLKAGLSDGAIKQFLAGRCEAMTDRSWSMIAAAAGVSVASMMASREEIASSPLPNIEATDIRVDLLSEIEAFLRARQATGFAITEATFGRNAVDDGKFVHRLRDGQNIGINTVARARKYMAEHIEGPARRRRKAA